MTTVRFVGVQSTPTDAMYESANTSRTSAHSRLVFALSYIAAGRLGGQSNGLASHSVIFVIFVV